MAVPKYNEFMIPILKLCSDKKEYSLKDVIEIMSNEFNLSEADKNEMLPSGTQTTLYNRIGWAKTYLIRANLIEKVNRGTFKITHRGLEFLKNETSTVDIILLKQNKDLQEYQSISFDKLTAEADNIAEIQKSITPEESFEYGYSNIIDNLSYEILEKLKTVSPSKFEHIVVELLVKMGYGGSFKEAAGQVVGKSGDAGIDGIIKEDKLGLDFIYLQAKKWQDVVSRPEIQKFAGALLGKKSKKGIFITTSRYSKEAEEYVKSIDASIILLDGEKLARLMIENNLGTTIINTYEIKKIDNDYYEE